MLKIVVILIITAAIAMVGLLTSSTYVANNLTILIALCALMVSVISAFKEDLFPFRPYILLDEILITPTSGPSHDSLIIILPILISNKGYGSGVIEGLTLKISSLSETKIYTPLIEVDYHKFMSGKRTLHSSNITGTFNPFLLASRESMRKNIVFSQEENSVRYPFNKWSEGKYSFQLFVKHSGSKLPIELGFINQLITAKLLAECQSGVAVSLRPSRELHI